MSISLATPISGIQTSITRHDITANDIANINTPGYAEKTPRQTDMRPEGVRISSISTTPNSSTTLSNVDLAEESKEQIQNKDTLAANVSVLKTKDRMIGELLDIVA
jgi:flagellar hook protein FlgE